MTELMRRRRALMAAKKGSGKSDMNGWTDGVPYTDITIIQNEYYAGNKIAKYNGWDRTGYIPCNGASYLQVSAAAPPNQSSYNRYNVFVRNDYSYISQFNAPSSGVSNITVPPDAAYVGFSNTSTHLRSMITSGVTPFA